MAGIVEVEDPIPPPPPDLQPPEPEAEPSTAAAAAPAEVEPLEQQLPQEIEDEEDENPQSQAMDISPPDHHPTPASEETKVSPTPTTVTSTARKGKKKKPPLTTKQRSIAKEKLRLLRANFDPQHFVPSNIDVDITLHEKVLRLLGLWDFANLRLDREIRRDLLIDLIGHYDKTHRRSFVKRERIPVSRAELVRALGIPFVKGGGLLIEPTEAERQLLADQASKTALVKFLLNWVVLIGDIGIVPDSAQAAIGMIESGQPDKVDWGGLLWSMVEKELLEVPKSGFCYYASHLQQLLRHRNPALFKEKEEEPLMEVPVAEEAEEDVAVAGDVVAEKVENVGDAEPEKQQQGTAFGLDLGGDEGVGEDGQQQWFLGGKHEAGEHCLRRCSSNDVQSMDFDNANDGGHGVQHPERCEDDFTSKFPNLDSSVDLLQGMEAGNVSFCPPMQQNLDPSSGEFLASPMRAHKSMNYCPTSSSLFGNTGKRMSDKIEDDGDEEEDEDDMHHFSHGVPKRIRTDGPWGQAEQSFELEQAMNWILKAKVTFAQKGQEIMNAQMQLQYLSELVQQKDQIVQSLERSRMEEQHKRQLEICQFEHERIVMSHMVVGYQKALRDTRHAFAEYRKQFPQGVEPLYKDVAGAGGLVLTARELERQRLEKSELERQRLEMRELENQTVIKMVLEFTREWSSKFENYEENVLRIAKRLEELHEETGLLKDRVAKNKCSGEIPE